MLIFMTCWFKNITDGVNYQSNVDNVFLAFDVLCVIGFVLCIDVLCKERLEISWRMVCYVLSNICCGGTQFLHL
jgi:hypothetical protein